MSVSRISTTCGIVCSWGMWLVAHAEPLAERNPDPDLPRALSAGCFDELRKSSPFTRTLDWSTTLKLTGVAYVDGQPVATIYHTKTKKRYLLDSTPNEFGWRVAEVTPSSEIEAVQVQIIADSETITIGYSEAELTPGKSKLLPQGIPTRKEYIGRDAKGEFVRVWPYLSNADRAKYLSRSVSPQLRSKFTSTVHDQRDRLLKASHEERAAATQKAFNSIIGK